MGNRVRTASNSHEFVLALDEIVHSNWQPVLMLVECSWESGLVAYINAVLSTFNTYRSFPSCKLHSQIATKAFQIVQT